MTHSDTAGFLTVITSEAHGVFGGYLVLNKIGRPLEFHCTAPVKPNRAQEILYGPTLEEYLYAEQIGQTLVQKSSTAAPAIYTDKEELLALRHYVKQPVSLVLSQGDLETSASQRGTQLRIDQPHDRAAGWHSIEHGQRRVVLADDGQDAVVRVRQHLDSLSDALDLQEPFERIREAINEAQIAGR